MVSLSQVEENMEIKFKKKHQGAAFIAPVESILLYGKDVDSCESLGEETRWMLYQNVKYGI